METENLEKVYFIHEGGMGLAADFFIKGIKPVSTEEEASEIEHIDYYMPGCEYVKQYLKEHPDFVYIGSTDNMHMFGDDGWGMDFDDYAEVDCPILQEDVE